MSRDVIIETRNLTKVYRDFWGRPKVQALKALDLQVHRGEIFGLLGPNGSGKTTTIKLLLGLLFPTEGDALIFNEPTTNVAKNERIGYLPEESYLYKFLNAEETLHFYGRLFKISAAERTKRVDRLIDMVGLNAAKHRQLREYSKGMQRRIGLAQALINDPELILLDEPTSGLDPIGTAEIKELIRDLRDPGQDDRPLGPPPGRHAGHLRPDRDPAPRRAEGAGQGHRPADGAGRDADQDEGPARGGPAGDPRGDRPARRRSSWRSTTRRRRWKSSSCGSSARATCTRAVAAWPSRPPRAGSPGARRTRRSRRPSPDRRPRDAGRRPIPRPGLTAGPSLDFGSRSIAPTGVEPADVEPPPTRLAARPRRGPAGRARFRFFARYVIDRPGLGLCPRRTRSFSSDVRALITSPPLVAGAPPGDSGEVAAGHALALAPRRAGVTHPRPARRADHLGQGDQPLLPAGLGGLLGVDRPEGADRPRGDDWLDIAALVALIGSLCRDGASSVLESDRPDHPGLQGRRRSPPSTLLAIACGVGDLRSGSRRPSGRRSGGSGKRWDLARPGRRPRRPARWGSAWA